MNETIVSMQGICKSFPGVKALDNVHFELRSGEVMALLGGERRRQIHADEDPQWCLHQRQRHGGDLRKILIDGPDPQGGPATGRGHHSSGAEYVPPPECGGEHVPGPGKAEGRPGGPQGYGGGSQADPDDLRISISPTETVGNLPVSKQQMVEIAKALSINARVLIMDEPTSALTAKEIDELFRIIRKLRDNGCGIVYISHRLEELQHIVDRVTIMRDGQYITSMNFKETTMDEIITNMVGREIKEQFPRVQCEKGQKIFEVRNLNAGRMVRNINFELYAGEIVGFAGLMGAGRTETTRAIFGVDPKESGELLLDGKPVIIRCPADAIKAGIVLAPEDRKKDGLCTKLPIRENIALPNLDLLCSKLGVVNRRKEDAMCAKAVKDLKIKTPNVEIEAGGLSGGNQQKVVVGKWLARNSRVVIFDEPTRGIDVAAKVEIYNLMNQLKQQGIAVMFVSSEMPEVMGIADRIIVMCDGRITGEVMARQTSQTEILTLATRFEKKFAEQAAEGGAQK